MIHETQPEANIDTRRKRLIYRANYRGFKEADLLLGGFAKTHVPTMDEADLGVFENLLEETDHNIYDWIKGSKPLPAQFDTPLFARLKNYSPL